MKFFSTDALFYQATLVCIRFILKERKKQKTHRLKYKVVQSKLYFFNLLTKYPGNLATLPCVGMILNVVLGNINIHRMLFVSRQSLGSLTDAKSNKTEVEDDKNDRDLIIKSCKLSTTIVKEKVQAGDQRYSQP